MGSEEKADALEDYLSQQLDAEVEEQQAAAGNAASAPARFPTVAELEAQVETRNWRRGAGGLFVAGILGEGGHVKRLDAMPAKPALLDFFKLRLAPGHH